ncbi:MAG: hypothetical protein P8L26_03125 [Alphaproteobacteria bacterium]|nr:hypothetical protein [Alphaproteobacteria bacterium]
MEKLIKNKKNLYIAGPIFLVLILLFFYISINNNSKNEKYFDVILASLYNDEEVLQERSFSFLSNIDDPNVSFFGDLSLSSIENLEKYEKIDRDLILLKKTIIENNSDLLQSLSLDENFIFKDLAKIFFLNIDLDNYSKIYADNSEDVDNFFLKAVSRYNNENN